MTTRAQTDKRGRAVEDGYGPVYTVDPVSKKAYLRHARYSQGGFDRWEEWYDPQGNVLLRLEWSPRVLCRIAKGSIEAVRAVNPDYFSAEKEAQVKAALTDRKFNLMAGASHSMMHHTISIAKTQEPTILASMEARSA